MKQPADSRHHRKCRSHGGSSHPSNISMVTTKQHQAWHLLFGNHYPEMIAKIINRVWIDPDYEMVAVPKKGGVS